MFLKNVKKFNEYFFFCYNYKKNIKKRNYNYKNYKKK